jgi:hypothetical protein
VRRDRQAGFAVRERGSAHQLRVNPGEGTAVDANLHQRRPDPGVVDAALTLPDPSRRELLGGFDERMRRQVLVLRRPVIASVRQDVDARRHR